MKYSEDKFSRRWYTHIGKNKTFICLTIKKRHPIKIIRNWFNKHKHIEIKI